jgi:hypothetical protein
MKPYTWITIALLLVSSLVLIFHLSTTGEEFSRYNVGWSGTSDFFSTLDRHTTHDITSPMDLAGYSNATLLLIAPDREITTADGAAYRDFVARGNTLLLADDFGSGTTFLRSIDSTIKIRPGNLSSVDRGYADAYMVVVHPVGSAGFLPAGSSLMLDQAATLTGGERLLSTTVFSWVDETPDRKLTGGEVLGTYTVMAREKIGNGTLYVLSDPSIFINGMDDPGVSPANRLFREKIAQAPAPLLIDTYASRTARVEGTGEIIHSVRSNDEYKFVIAALLIAGILIAWQRRVI